MNRFKSLMTIFFTEAARVRNYDDAQKCDTKLYGRFFEHMFKNGINLAPSQFEALFISVQHKEEDIDRFLEIFRKI